MTLLINMFFFYYFLTLIIKKLFDEYTYEGFRNNEFVDKLSKRE
jgi:hypothetical protein